MTSSNRFLVDTFPLPNNINHIVCCDVDETYIPFSNENKINSGINELEQHLITKCSEFGIMIGWITGSNLKSIIKKSDGYISKTPHFICCSLGTEFYWIDNGVPVLSKSWKNQIEKSGFNSDKIEKTLKEIKSNNIDLIRQPDDYQGYYKHSFYYEDSENTTLDFKLINEIANEAGIKVMFTKCNPAAGDPENCFDVEFIPICCGKDETILFLTKELSVKSDVIHAIGDSCNDLPMLKKAGNGYLVNNADNSAKILFPNILDNKYCFGILDVVRGITS